MITRYSDFVFEPKQPLAPSNRPILEKKEVRKEETPLRESLIDDVISSKMELPIPVDIRRNYGDEEEVEFDNEEYYEEPIEKTITDFIDPAYIKSTQPTFMAEPEEVVDEPIITEPQIPMDQLFTDLTTIVGKTINITGCSGAAGCTRSIATAKGWTVTG